MILCSKFLQVSKVKRIFILFYSIDDIILERLSKFVLGTCRPWASSKYASSIVSYHIEQLELFCFNQTIFIMVCVCMLYVCMYKSIWRCTQLEGREGLLMSLSPSAWFPYRGSLSDPKTAFIFVLAGKHYKFSYLISYQCRRCRRCRHVLKLETCTNLPHFWCGCCGSKSSCSCFYSQNLLPVIPLEDPCWLLKAF